VFFSWIFRDNFLKLYFRGVNPSDGLVCAVSPQQKLRWYW